MLIIGCGHLNRNDDAVSIIIAQRLLQYLVQYPFDLFDQRFMFDSSRDARSLKAQYMLVESP